MSTLCPNMLKIAKDGLIKFGKLSTPYLIRKLKCTPNEAFQIILHLTSDITYYVASKNGEKCP